MDKRKSKAQERRWLQLMVVGSAVWLLQGGEQSGANNHQNESETEEEVKHSNTFTRFATSSAYNNPVANPRPIIGDKG